MAAIGNSLMKSHSYQTLWCTLQDTTTVILLDNFFVHFDGLILYISQQRFY